MSFLFFFFFSLICPFNKFWCVVPEIILLYYSTLAVHLFVALTLWQAEYLVMCSTAGLRKCSGRRPVSRLCVLCLAWVPAGPHQLLVPEGSSPHSALPHLYTAVQQEAPLSTSFRNRAVFLQDVCIS